MATNNNEKLQELSVEEKLQHLYELQRIDTEIDKIRTLRRRTLQPKIKTS